jgi:UDP-3-O-[3-hydroxymyristoyl] glucosamine N-acyltransferase
VVDDVQTGVTARDTSLVFASTKAHVREAAASPARAIVVSATLVDEVPSTIETVLIAKNPQLALARVAKKFFAQTRAHIILAGSRIHDSAYVSDLAQLGRDCIIGPGAVIGDDCVLGDRCIVGANSVLEPGVKLGAGTHIHPLVFIGHGCELGRECEVHPNTSIGMEGFGYAQDEKFNHYRLTHYGRVILEDQVHVGAGVQIDRGTFEDSRIGQGTKIDNHCHFGHNIRIGRNTLVTAAMITAGSTTIGSACVFGGRATIKGHLTIADGSQFAGISAIGNNVIKAGEYGGHPLQPLRDEMRTRASLKKLPQLVRQVRQILKHLGLEGGAE